ncbi:unnamed protein product [Cylindrotheca closterium]|uniref:Uncharacterized protein n=1 Tax=Cylindrotheca closterium TaxID=2856 RepID=A0AAD2JIZ9_9STRA|nr:unnamed protein product [Cylindrotheca closterium]
MVFNMIFSRIESLVDSTETVEDSIPCKSNILSLRECRKGDKSKCNALGLDLLSCMAEFKVDETARVRANIGVAKYNEYLKFLEEKHGAEEAAKIVAEPAESLKDVKAMKMLHNLSQNVHPKGAPSNEEEKQNWTYADQVRLEMGEQEWWSSVGVVASEFGMEKTDSLFNLTQETLVLQDAAERVFPGTKDAQSKRFDKLKMVMEPVSSAAKGASTVEEVMAVFKEVYPTEADLKSKFN